MDHGEERHFSRIERSQNLGNWTLLSMVVTIVLGSAGMFVWASEAHQQNAEGIAELRLAREEEVKDIDELKEQINSLRAQVNRNGASAGTAVQRLERLELKLDRLDNRLRDEEMDRRN